MIRTRDPLLPKQVRYQAALHSVTVRWAVYSVPPEAPQALNHRKFRGRVWLWTALRLGATDRHGRPRPGDPAAAAVFRENSTTLKCRQDSPSRPWLAEGSSPGATAAIAWPDLTVRPARRSVALGNPTRYIGGHVGVSPSGKAADFDSAIRRFESCHPSQNVQPDQRLSDENAPMTVAGRGARQPDFRRSGRCATPFGQESSAKRRAAAGQRTTGARTVSCSTMPPISSSP